MPPVGGVAGAVGAVIGRCAVWLLLVVPAAGGWLAGAVAPGAGALALVLWIGAFAILHGVVLVALALRLRRARIEEWPAPMARAA